jgi:hypothetical protein
MYTILFYKNQYSCPVKAITDARGLSDLANLLENNKIRFQVWMIAGDQLSQNHLGYGGFEFWISPGEKFFP